MNKGLGLFAIGALAFFVLRGWQKAPTAPTAAPSYPPDVTGATGTIATPSLGGVGAPALTGMPKQVETSAFTGMVTIHPGKPTEALVPASVYREEWLGARMVLWKHKPPEVQAEKLAYYTGLYEKLETQGRLRWQR